MDLKRGIDKAVEAIVADLAKQAKVVEATLKIKQIASISANNDEVMGFNYKAFAKVGKEGYHS
jgi:chaperonin GroEL